MKRIIFALLMLSFVILNAIDMYPATGNNITSTRDSLLYYHNNCVDQNWYGTNSWAVKYDFMNYYANIDRFTATGAHIFFPNVQSDNDLTIKLCSNDVNQPNLDALLFTQTLSPSEITFQDWNIIEFPEAITDTIVWLVIDFPTNSSDQFIAASAVGGGQSYYEDDGFYFNMLSNGYNSEFLFSLKGSFETDGNDLDLAGIDWHITQPSAGDTLSPIFTVINNAEIPILNSYIEVDMVTPNGNINLQYFDGTLCDSISIPNLEPNETTIIDVSDYLFFRLRDQPSQYEVSATLFCPSDSLMDNNFAESEFDTFSISRYKALVENIVQIGNDSFSEMLEDQTSLVNENSLFINYFAEPSEFPYFCEDSYNRFHYYDLTGFPATIIDGGEKIIGYLGGYADMLNDHLQDVYDNKKTFVDSIWLSGYVNEDDDVELVIRIKNENTFVFGNFLDECTINVSIIEDIPNIPEEIDFEINVMRKQVASIELLEIGWGTTFTDTIYFNQANDFTTIGGDLSNCSAFIWLQNNETKDIFAVDFIAFDDFIPTSAQETEMEIPKISVSISANPYSISGNLKIQFSPARNISDSEVTIYNLKGQLVKKLKSSSNNPSFCYWNGRNENGKTVANGIYFLKAKTKQNNKLVENYKKFIVLKK